MSARVWFENGRQYVHADNHEEARAALLEHDIAAIGEGLCPRCARRLTEWPVPGAKASGQCAAHGGWDVTDTPGGRLGDVVVGWHSPRLGRGVSA